MSLRDETPFFKRIRSRGLCVILIITICYITAQYFSLGDIPKDYCLVTKGDRSSKVTMDEKNFFVEVTVPDPERTLYVITATYKRHQQMAELTRLAQTLMHVPNLVWLVVEDAHSTTKRVEELLNRTGMAFVHLAAPMPESFKDESEVNRPRGVSNRNRGLEWIRANATSGVIYFADDDNSYDIRLFKEMRDTKVLSMWPVGLLSAGFASPVLQDGKVVGFYEGWNGGRLFPVDMAGFAISVDFLLQRPNATMPYEPGYEEDGFLQSLLPFSMTDIECKASNCTEVLVWHTQTVSPSPLQPVNATTYAGTNLMDLYQSQI